MGFPVRICLIFQGILVELNNQNLFLTISLCTFGTRYGLEHIVSASSFNLKSPISDIQVPSVPYNNSLVFCNNFSNPSRCTYVRCWYWFSMTLFKSSFSYLKSKIKRNQRYRLVMISLIYSS